MSNTKNQPSNFVLKGFSLLTIVSVTILLHWLLGSCNKAIDFIDEGFYLNWISNPWLYDFFVTQFGFIYYPLYRLVGGDLILLRQSNILITYLLAFLLVKLVLNHQFKNLDKLFLTSVSLAIASVSLLILIRTDSWIPTPSYNTLTFHGALVFFTGLLLTHYYQKVTLSYFVGAFLIGLGGWLIFIGKPPSAALLALFWLSSILIFSRTKFSLNAALLAGASAVALLLITAYVVSESVSAYAKALSDGLKGTNLFDAGHAKTVWQLFRIDNIYFPIYAKFVLLLVGVISFMLSRFASNTKKINIIFVSLAVFCLCLLSILITQGFFVFKILAFRFYLLTVLIMVFGLLLGFTLGQKLKHGNAINKNYPIVFMAFLMPYILTLGTGNNYWQIASSTALFWLLSLLFLLYEITPNVANYSRLAITSSLTFSLVTILIFTSQLVPYNQLIPLKKITYPINVINTEQKLFVRKDMHAYITGLYSAAQQMSFVKGTPMIDLTGHYGTSLYLLGAKAIGLPYFFGGYKGSDEYATFALKKVSCDELSRAWLLIEQGGYRTISPDVLQKSAGIKLQDNYSYSEPFVSIINPPNSKWQNLTNKQYQQYLLKPTNAKKQTQACLAYRKTHPSPFE